MEDNASFRQTLVQVIGDWSDVEVAGQFEDCKSAVRRAKRHEPDVILLDIKLPGISGIECISRLKARLPHASIVMLTIHDDADRIFRAFWSGASGYLLKTASLDEIGDAVRQAFRGGMLMPAGVADKVLHFLQAESRQREYDLTEREVEVLQHMAQGQTQQDIAEKLFLSPHTVNSHVGNIYEKLHVNSSAAAVAKAIRDRVIR